MTASPGILASAGIMSGCSCCAQDSSFGLCIGLFAGIAVVAPSAEALELRRSETMVTIEATEVIEDTILAAADTVIVEGEIHGDLVAAGRRVVVNGAVHGNLFAAAESVAVHGDVQGLVAAAASNVELGETDIGGDLYAFGETIEVSGSIGEDVEAFAAHLNLLSGAVITGDVRVRTEDEDRLQQSASPR